MTMKPLMPYLFIALVVCLFLGCTKSTPHPCDGLMNESPPLKIGIMLTDKLSENNLVLINGLKESDIKITEAQTGKTYTNWRILKTLSSPLNGMLEIAVFHETAGAYAYKIELKDLGVVAMAYNIKQEKSTAPCKTFYYPLNGLRAVNHQFAAFTFEHKPYPNIIMVYLN